MKTTKVLLTGATGLLGSRILKFLVFNTNVDIVLLIRGREGLSILDRGQQFVTHLLKQNIPFDKQVRRISILRGDVSLPYLGLNNKIYNQLLQSTHQIFHCAALTKFNASAEALASCNIEGTKHFLKFVKQCHVLKSGEYISSIFIAGKHRGEFSEIDLDKGQRFNNLYEKSKFDAEIEVRRCVKEGFKINVYRPSVIVGEYVDGSVINPGLLYQLFKLLKLGIYSNLPLSKESSINIIPCDIAAEIICRLSALQTKQSSVYHVVARKDFQIEQLVEIACKFFLVKKPHLVKWEEYVVDGCTIVEKRIWESFLPYFRLRYKVNSNLSQKALLKINSSLPILKEDFILRVLKYMQIL